MTDIRSLFNCLDSKSFWQLFNSILSWYKWTTTKTFSFFIPAHETEDLTTFHENSKEEKTFMKPPRQQSVFQMSKWMEIWNWIARLLAGRLIAQNRLLSWSLTNFSFIPIFIFQVLEDSFMQQSVDLDSRYQTMTSSMRSSFSSYSDTWKHNFLSSTKKLYQIFRYIFILINKRVKFILKKAANDRL